MVHNQSLRSYIIYSIIRVIGLFLSVTAVSFILLRNLPGDPIDLLILEYGKLSQPMIEYLNGYYSDSHPWWTHLRGWMKIVFSDSRLMSKLYHKPVFELIFEHIANTFFLMFTAMFCSAYLAFIFFRSPLMSRHLLFIIIYLQDIIRPF